MDIIAAHRQGLIEQLDEEVMALAGRGRDHVQRTIVLHHLYDHSRGNHCWALAEARRALRIDGGLSKLKRRLGQWGWSRAGRERARAALEQLAEAMGEAGRLRAAAAYRAYRISSSAALRDEAEASLDPALLDLLDQCHAARRGGQAVTPEQLSLLAELSEAMVCVVVDQGPIDAAWAAIDATGLKHMARRLIGDHALARMAAKDLKRGAARIERELLTDAVLPPSFRANPAQHFYAIQLQLRERRRQQWREACDQEPDAFGLAA